jgi:hypothetical protein
MQAEWTRVDAQPQINRSRRVGKVELDEQSTSVGPGSRREWNAEEALGLAVTEDSAGEVLAERRDLNLELGMLGRHEGRNREDELGSCGRKVQWSQLEGGLFPVRPDTRSLKRRPPPRLRTALRLSLR